MKVAIVHYWLVDMRGGEKVLEALCELFPQADIFTHVCDHDKLSDTLKNHTIKTSFIQKLPKATRWYQKYLPLMPLALENLDLSGYDLVLSSESGPAKGVIVPPTSLHICYCHTPMRYIWDMYHDYRAQAGFITRLIMPLITHYLRIWDVSTAARVDYFVANSSYVASRINKYYRREAKVIHPPVDVNNFTQSDELGDYYLMMGQLVGYKRVDLAIKAFNESGRKLVVIGDGEQMKSLQSIAADNVQLLGWQPFSVIREHYAKCRALVFPGMEDFGIVPVEAMASGRPVIAYRKGGAMETVVDGVSGSFFEEQTVEALNQAIETFENNIGQFSKAKIVEHAGDFDREIFKARFKELVDQCLLSQVDT